jgi:DNA-binding response OmpR family regulator
MNTGKVLIVEGDLSLSGLLQNRLKDKGYDVHSRNTGEKALEELKKEWVDLLIISTNIQGEMDGFSLIKEIKKDVSLAKIPILVDSDKPGIKEVIESMGIDGFIEKPFDINELTGKVEHILTHKKKNDTDKI